MPHSSINKRLNRTSDLCDELAQTMSDLQDRLENRRSRMRRHMDLMARGLRMNHRI